MFSLDKRELKDWIILNLAKLLSSAEKCDDLMLGSK